MIQNYNAVNEEEAIKYLSKEIGMDHKEIKKLIKKDPMSHIDLVKHGIRKRVEIIGHSGFNIPYGYNYNDGMLIIKSKESGRIKNIYSCYLEGKSMGEISKMLNSNKVTTKKGGDEIHRNNED